MTATVINPFDPLMQQGEFLVFTIHSRSRPRNPHRVDLEAFDGNGACDCEHFVFKLAPELKHGAEPSERYECWHIRQAKRKFCCMMIRALVNVRGPSQEAESVQPRRIVYPPARARVGDPWGDGD
jgi:hypothetical protein